MLAPFDVTSRTRLVFGPGSLARLSALVRELGGTRVLLVHDRKLAATDHPARVKALLGDVVVFDDFDEDPDGDDLARGAAVLRASSCDMVVALGGGSSLDCAKGLNLLSGNPGTIADYRGYGRATEPLRPMIAIPTTAGTGSDAQSYAVIADAATGEKMACGDPGMAFRVALLDPELTTSLPPAVTAAAGIDALGHAVESWVTTRRNAMSALYAREAFVRLDGNFERVLDQPADVDARGAMLLGAHLAGLAIEASMLGAAHACANPLSARFGTAHGVAVGLTLPHVVRWNAAVVEPLYAELYGSGAALAERLEALAVRGGLPRRLRDVGGREEDLPGLAAHAATQWTGRFNPRPFDATAAESLYREAF